VRECVPEIEREIEREEFELEWVCVVQATKRKSMRVVWR